MAQVRIRKALQVKNRLAGELANLGKLIQENNSHLEGQGRFNVRELFTKRNETLQKLIAVKTAIAVANVTVYEKIARMAELKNEITLLRSLNTSEGEENIGYAVASKTVKRVAEVNAVDVEGNVEMLTSKIEALQDEIDHFNATTEITIPD
jgi:hypothetical protein